MCRWLAYSGTPILLGDLLYKPKHSLIGQSLHGNLGPYTTNGDGFGIGWYGEGRTPALFKASIRCGIIATSTRTQSVNADDDGTGSNAAAVTGKRTIARRALGNVQNLNLRSIDALADRRELSSGWR